MSAGMRGEGSDDAISVRAWLSYIEPSSTRPYFVFDNEGPARETNARYRDQLVTIRDARRVTTSLDVQGFTIAAHDSEVGDFEDDDEVRRVGWAEAGSLVRKLTGASEVVVFDHTIRRRQGKAPRLPIRRVHNDFTEASAPRRVCEVLGVPLKEFPDKPVAIINVWRSIHHPAIDWPLGLCDARTVSGDDLVAADIIYPGRRGEIYEVSYSKAHRWSYFSGLRPDEALVFKCYDSHGDRARFTPHTAFNDPTAPANAPARESIEFRVLAFFD